MTQWIYTSCNKACQNVGVQFFTVSRQIYDPSSVTLLHCVSSRSEKVLLFHPCLSSVHFSAWEIWITRLFDYTRHSQAKSALISLTLHIRLVYSSNQPLFIYTLNITRPFEASTFIISLIFSSRLYFFPHSTPWFHSPPTTSTPDFQNNDFVLLHTSPLWETLFHSNFFFTLKLSLLTLHTFIIASNVFKYDSTLILTSSCEKSSSLKQLPKR